jgi:hypothetical protein
MLSLRKTEVQSSPQLGRRNHSVAASHNSAAPQGRTVSCSWRYSCARIDALRATPHSAHRTHMQTHREVECPNSSAVHEWYLLLQLLHLQEVQRVSHTPATGVVLALHSPAHRAALAYHTKTPDKNRLCCELCHYQSNCRTRSSYNDSAKPLTS